MRDLPHYRSPYLAKCKRLRTDGPTPCLCCPADCIGHYPGHTFVQALIAMDLAERGPQVSVAQRALWRALGAEPDSPCGGWPDIAWQMILMVCVVWGGGILFLAGKLFRWW